MRNLIAKLLLTVAVLLGSAGVSFALPECDGSPLEITYISEWPSNWDYCHGKVTFNSNAPRWAGDQFSGEFRNGKRHGQGTSLYASGDKYVGEFRNGKKTGQGTYIHTNGDRYIGGYRNGKQHGQGTYIHASGNKYVGEYRNGERYGHGIYTWTNGDKYVGEYRNGKKHGQGTNTFGEGDKYVGEYRNGIRHGHGTYTSHEGHQYVGEFRNDKYNGNFVVTYPSGAKYIGQFKNGKKNGQGTIIFSDGRKKIGIWKNGEFEYAQKVKPPPTSAKSVIEYAVRLTGMERCTGYTYWDNCVNVHQRSSGYGRIYIQYYVSNRHIKTVEIAANATIDSLPKYALVNLNPNRSSPPTRIAKPKPPKVVSSAPTYANLSDPRLCKKALNSSRTSWDRSRKYRAYSNAAKRRGLTIKYCRLVLGISKPKPPVRMVKKKPKLIPIGTGSGFSITNKGHILTNEHVVRGCKAVVVHLKQKKFKKAVILSKDKKNDLALLKANFTPETVFSISQKNAQELDDVIVAGFPLSGTLSSTVKMTKGIVSSLAGIRNDYSRIQIDAAVQPGNSGGPIISSTGKVVAVAVEILKKEYFRKKSGIIPENTNFGVKATVARTFLEANDLVLPTSTKKITGKRAIRSLIKGGTYFLSCWSTKEVRAKLAKARRPAINVDQTTYKLIESILK